MAASPPETLPSIQDRFFADAPCFGCGPGNVRGLQLKSFEGPENTVRAVFRPWPEHDNGLGFLNGGIIATLLDCHSAAAVVLGAQQRGLVPDGTLHYVTAGIDVSYRRPSPLYEPAELVARLVSADDQEIIVDAELWWQDKLRASARSSWKRWRPRARPDVHASPGLPPSGSTLRGHVSDATTDRADPERTGTAERTGAADPRAADAGDDGGRRRV